MRLLINKIQDYRGDFGARGHCRLWLFHDVRDNAAVAVLTAIRGDTGPGPRAEAGAIATAVLREQGLDPGRTLWFVRRVAAPGREAWHQADFTHYPDADVLGDPQFTPATRAAVEILARCPMPEDSGDESGPIAPRK